MSLFRRRHRGEDRPPEPSPTVASKDAEVDRLVEQAQAQTKELKETVDGIAFKLRSYHTRGESGA